MVSNAGSDEGVLLLGAKAPWRRQIIPITARLEGTWDSLADDLGAVALVGSRGSATVRTGRVGMKGSQSQGQCWLGRACPLQG